MAQSLSFLNSKELKHFHKLLQEQFGYEDKLNYFVGLQENKDKYYLFSKDLARIDISDLRIDSMGLYFGATFEGKLRLSIEGTQLIGPQCTKRILDIPRSLLQQWMEGEKLPAEQLDLSDIQPGDFVIVRCGTEYLGCGKLSGDAITNYIPKTRYVHASYE